MAVDDRPDPLDRALEVARHEETPGWTEVSESVMARVRRLVMPAALVRTFGDDGQVARGPFGSTVLVSGRVLVPLLRRVVDSPTRAVDAIDVEVDDDRCTSVRVSLVGSYGTDLQEEGAKVHEIVTQTIRSVLGPDPDFDPSTDVEVQFVDVVDGDPHTT